MRLDNGAVDHHVFIVMICGEIAKDTLNHTVFTPAAQTSVHVFPVPKTARKITLGDTCTIAIQHSSYEKAVVCSSPEEGLLSAPIGRQVSHRAASVSLPQNRENSQQRATQSTTLMAYAQCLTEDTP